MGRCRRIALPVLTDYPVQLYYKRRGTYMKNLADLCGLAVFDNNSTRHKFIFMSYKICKRVLCWLLCQWQQLWSSNKRWHPSFPFWRVFRCDVFVSMTGYQFPYLHIPYRSLLSWIGSPIFPHTFTFVFLADLQIFILLHRNQITFLSRKNKHWKL